MKKIRLIPRLDIKGQNLVKGIHLEGFRALGNANDFIAKYKAKHKWNTYDFQAKYKTRYRGNPRGFQLNAKPSAKEILVVLAKYKAKCKGNINDLKEIAK